MVLSDQVVLDSCAALDMAEFIVAWLYSIRLNDYNAVQLLRQS